MTGTSSDGRGVPLGSSRRKSRRKSVGIIGGSLDDYLLLWQAPGGLEHNLIIVIEHVLSSFDSNEIFDLRGRGARPARLGIA